MVKLGGVLEHRKEFITIDDLTTYKRVTAKLHAKGIVLRDEIEGARLKTKKQQVCKAGDFLVAEIDAKVGGFGIVPDELEGAIVSSHYFLFEINEEKLEKKYLDYFIRTPDFQKQISARGSTNYAAIRPKHVLDLEIPLPPLEKQKRIVARVESLMTRIEEARRLRAEAVEDAEELLTATVKKVIFAHEFKFSILKEICETTSGGTPSRSRPDYFQGKIPWLKSGELNDDWIADSEEHITEEALRNSNAKVFPKGTLLIALYGATVGKTGILSQDSATNQAICALFPKKDVLERDYLHWFLKFKRNEFLGQSFGGAQPNISQRLLRNIKIPLPPLPIQRRIVAYLDSLQVKVDELKRLQAETEKEIEELIPSILDKAFKGEL